MIISTFTSIHKAYVNEEHNLNWDELAELLIHHFDKNSKTEVELYNLAKFKPLSDPTVEWGRKYRYIDGIKQDEYDEIPNTVRRSKANIIAIYGIVLDVDKEKTIEEVILQLDGLEYVLYTTFRHTFDDNRFRVVIPFSQPLLAGDIPKYQDDIKKMFPGVDSASFSASQSFYFHSGKTDSIAFRNHGLMINPYDFEEKQPDPIIDYEPSNYDEQFVDSLLQEIARKEGDLKGRYEVWCSIAWATCHVLGITAAQSLMMKYWPTKTKKELNSLKSFNNNHNPPKIGTLIKLSGLNKYQVYDLEKEYKHRNNIPVELSASQALRQLRKKIRIY